MFPDAGPGRGESKCAPDIGKPILLADAVVIIDYYLNQSARRGRAQPNEAWRVKRKCVRLERSWKHFLDGSSSEPGEEEEEEGGGSLISIRDWIQSGHSDLGYLRLCSCRNQSVANVLAFLPGSE